MTDNRLEREKKFHNKQFGEDSSERETAAKYYSIIGKTRDFYLNRILSLCKGKRLLEYGCGMGGSSALFARTASAVTGIDISSEGILKAAEYARKNNVHIDFHVMDAEKMQFPDNSFDVVVGTGILHHLDLSRSLSELSRVLSKEGHAIFLEPLGHNIFINLFRKFTPSMRTSDEHPLHIRDIELAKKYFHSVDTRFFHFFTLLAIPFRNTFFFRKLVDILSGIDNTLFYLFPFSKRYAWMVVLELGRPRKISENQQFHGFS
jgi:ubiquinone/menaquinone biosynthesis C-methylase UbiE